MNADYARTRKVVEHYRKLGLCPLPSSMEYKGPMMPTYADYYGDTPVPEHYYDRWATTNVQILTGTKTPTKTKVIAVDMDGPEAIDAFIRIAMHHEWTPCDGWVSITGGGGRHHWFTLPDGTTECPSGIIWGLIDTWGEKTQSPQWVKHKEIRILADNALVVAPPSVHVDTGKRYEFALPLPSKVNLLPEPAPAWLLAMPRLVIPRLTGPPPARQEPKKFLRTSGRFFTREEVIAAVGDQKFDIATREWGLVSDVTGPNPSGWCSCYIPGREDPRYSRPSGSFHFQDGTLQDRKDLTCVSFFDLAVLLGKFERWQDARDSLGERFLGPRGPKEEVIYKYSYNP